MKYVAGVRMGSFSSPTALCIVKHVLVPQGRIGIPDAAYFAEQPQKVLSTFEGVRIQRIKERTAISTVVSEIKNVMAIPKLAGQTMLVVDMTDAGKAIYDELTTELIPPIAVHVTTAREVTVATGGYAVPLADIVSVMQLVIGQRRFKVNPGIPLAEEFFEQMNDFSVPEKQHDTVYKRSRSDDDLVRAMGVAAWYAQATLARVTYSLKRAKDLEYDPLRFGLEGR